MKDFINRFLRLFLRTASARELRALMRAHGARLLPLSRVSGEPFFTCLALFLGFRVGWSDFINILGSVFRFENGTIKEDLTNDID